MPLVLKMFVFDGGVINEAASLEIFVSEQERFGKVGSGQLAFRG